MPLNEKALALSGGVVWGLTIFGTTLLSAATGFGSAMMEIYGSIHPGYAISYVGAFVGLIYAFACAAIGLFVFAKLYNYLGKRL